MSRANKRLSEGHVAAVDRSNAQKDMVLRMASREVLRRRSVSAAIVYRDKGNELMSRRTASLLGSFGESTISRIRRHLELDDMLTGKRALRLRVAWGLSQMRLMPSQEQLRQSRRDEFDAPGHIGHYLTTASLRGVVRWDYIRGSGTQGIRRYETECGLQKRLQAHTNRYWEPRRCQRDAGDSRMMRTIVCSLTTTM